DGILLRVVFKPEMTNAELQDLLGSVGAQVVQGPTEAGVFTLQLDDSNRNVGAVLERVRAHPRVVFAEHVYEGRRP
uniref:S8 family serine peptidase n=1 Tax=Salmonella enterica TaxID=28901 RepID=UPI003D768425